MVFWRLIWQTWLSQSITNALSRTCLNGYSSVIEPSPWFQIALHSSIICSRGWKDTLSLRNCTLHPADIVQFTGIYKCGGSHYDWILGNKIYINQNWDFYANKLLWYLFFLFFIFSILWWEGLLPQSSWGPWFDPELELLFGICVYALPSWVYSLFSRFLPPPKKHASRWIILNCH